ncbi:MAG: response regulator [Alphaproteobacteria bacterium]|nr:response regulator [Alphaproteobacteria bacterium]
MSRRRTNLASAIERWLDALYPEALRRDQLSVLAQTTPINAIATMVNSAIIGVVFWPAGPRGLVLGWTGTVWAFGLFQLWRWNRFRSRVLPQALRAGSWRKPVLWATLAGLLWSSALVFLPGAGPTETLTLCVAFAGVAAGGAATLAVLPLAAAGFVLGVLAPVTVFFLLYSDLTYAGVGAFSIMMILTLLNSTTVVFRWFSEARAAQLRERMVSERVHDFARSASHWFWELDANLRFSYLATETVEDGGIEPSAFLGLTYRETKPDGVSEEQWSTHDATLAARQPLIDFRYSRVFPNGSRRWLSVDGRPFFAPDGRFLGYRGTGRDLTDVVEAQAATEAARLRAEQASQAKSEFLAVMSHELRTPLASVISGIDLLAAKAMPPDQRKLVDQVLESALQLTELIGDILDLSKLEAGQIVLERLPFSLPEILRSAVGTLEPRARAKGLSVSLEIGAGADGWRLGDPTRLRQIVLNLVTNAIKFTDRGTIKVAAMVTADTDVARLTVTDTGIGISEEIRSHVFEKFAQADQTITRRFGGAGLGLAICKQLVDAMGGQIDFESEVGKGPTFWLTCRLPPTKAPAAVAPSRADPSTARQATGVRARVLLVEDNDVNRRLIAEMIGGWGIEVAQAADGGAGVAAASGSAFDAIVMDIQMPGIDGLEAVRLIRAQDGPNRRTPIIALTGNAFEDDRQIAMAAGFDDYLAKPIRPDSLKDALTRQLSAQGLKA